MRAVLLDANVWSWTLLGTQNLTAAAVTATNDTANRYLSPVSLYEISQKARLGKWPEMVAALPRLYSSAEAQGLAWAPVDAEVCLLGLLAGTWHRLIVTRSTA